MKRGWKLALGGLVIAGLVAGLTVVMAVSRPTLAQVTVTGGSKLRPAWSPDGQTLSYLQVFTVDAVDGDRLTMLFATDLAGAAPKDLTRGYLTAGDRYAWSSEGDAITLHTFSEKGDQIAVFSPSGEGVTRAVYPAETVRSKGAWAPEWDSSTGPAYFFALIQAGKAAVVAVKPEAASRILAFFDVGPFESLDLSHFAVALSPDGHWLACKTETAIQVIPESGGKGIAITSGADALTEPVWSPDSRSLAFVDDRGRLMIAPIDGSSPRILARGLIARGVPDWSRSGRVIAVAAKGREGDGIYAIDTARGRTRQLVSAAGCSWPKWSPDGRRLAFLLTTDSGGTDLWIHGRR